MRFILRGYPDQSSSADRVGRPLARQRARVDEVEIPGSEGYFGVLPGHTPLLALLGAGELWYRKGQEKLYLCCGLRLRRGAARPRHHPGADRRARRRDRRQHGPRRPRSAPRNGWRRRPSTSTSSAPGSRCSSRSSGSRSRPALASDPSGPEVRLSLGDPGISLRRVACRSTSPVKVLRRTVARRLQPRRRRARTPERDSSGAIAEWQDRREEG